MKEETERDTVVVVRFSPKTQPGFSLRMEERGSRLKLRQIASWAVKIGPLWGWMFS